MLRGSGCVKGLDAVDVAGIIQWAIVVVVVLVVVFVVGLESCWALFRLFRSG